MRRCKDAVHVALPHPSLSISFSSWRLGFRSPLIDGAGSWRAGLVRGVVGEGFTRFFWGPVAAEDLDLVTT